MKTDYEKIWKELKQAVVREACDAMSEFALDPMEQTPEGFAMYGRKGGRTWAFNKIIGLMDKFENQSLAKQPEDDRMPEVKCFHMTDPKHFID